jgi:undecaprenyl-diphosphatase
MWHNLRSLKLSLAVYLKQITLLLALSFVLAFFIRLTHTPLFGPLDLKLFYLLNSGIKNRFFDVVIPFFSLDWFIFILVGIFFIYLIINKGVKVSLVFIITFILIFPFGILLKKTASLGRPYVSLTDVYYYNDHQWQLIKDTSSPNNGNQSSFPSGHALRFFVLVGFLWKSRKIRIFLLIIGGLMILSRIYTGVHYPSDTIAGAIIATYLGLLAHKIANF